MSPVVNKACPKCCEWPAGKSARQKCPRQVIGPEYRDIYGLAPIGEYWQSLAEILAQGICRARGIRELWSADRDFSGMRGVKVTNPVLNAAD